MQNSLNKEGTIVEFTSKSVVDAKKGVTAPSELVSQGSKLSSQQEAQKITPLKTRTVSVIKKDGTSEPFDSAKIISAVKKSAARALVELSEEDLKSICDFVNNNIVLWGKGVHHGLMRCL